MSILGAIVEGIVRVVLVIFGMIVVGIGFLIIILSKFNMLLSIIGFIIIIIGMGIMVAKYKRQ